MDFAIVGLCILGWVVGWIAGYYIGRYRGITHGIKLSEKAFKDSVKQVFGKTNA